MSKRVAKKNRLKKQQSSHVSDPQRFAYLLPQDEQRLAKETGAAATLECISDLSQDICLTRSQIAEKAIEKCNQIKEVCQYKQVCNDIEAFNKTVILAHTITYIYAQKNYQEHPHTLQTDVEAIAERGLEHCFQGLLDTADELLRAQQKSEVF